MAIISNFLPNVAFATGLKSVRDAGGRAAFAKFAFLATEVQSDAGAGSGLFFCSFRPTFALLGAELKSGRGAGGGVFFGQFVATFGPFAQSSNLVLVLVVVLFGVHFWANFAIFGQISNLAVVLVVGGVFGKVAVFPKVVVGVSSAFLWGFSPIWCPPPPPHPPPVL